MGLPSNPENPERQIVKRTATTGGLDAPYRSVFGDALIERLAEDLIALWEEMDGKTEYPMEDLVPQCTVAHAIAVSEGRRGYGYR